MIESKLLRGLWAFPQIKIENFKAEKYLRSCKIYILVLYSLHSHYSRTRDLGLKTCQRVKPLAEALIDSTPNSLVFTLFMHDQVNNWIDIVIVIFFCPLLFCIVKQAQPPPPPRKKRNSGIDLKLQFSIESFCPGFNPLAGF